MMVRPIVLSKQLSRQFSGADNLDAVADYYGVDSIEQITSPKFPSIQQLVGKPSYNLATFLAERFYFPTIFKENEQMHHVTPARSGIDTDINDVRALSFRGYPRSRKDTHLKAGQTMSASELSVQASCTVGLGDILNNNFQNTMEYFSRKDYYDKNDLNGVALTNNIPLMHSIPKEIVDTRIHYFPRLLGGVNSIVDVSHTLPSNSLYSANFDLSSIIPNSSTKLLFVDLVIPPIPKNVDHLKKEISSTIHQNGIPANFVIIKSSENGLHVACTNLLFSPSQLNAMKGYILRLEKINDSQDETGRMIDSHSLFYHATAESNPHGIARLNVAPDLKTNAMRINKAHQNDSQPIVIDYVAFPGSIADSSLLPYRVERIRL